MTAGSWIYIGSQGIVQGTYETFVEMGRQHYGGELAGRWILTAGLGGMGGAQPLAATMAGASMLAVECRPERIQKRLDTRYLDERADTLEGPFAEVVHELSNQYLLGYISTNSVKDGSYRKIDVLVNAPGAEVSARPGYYAPNQLPSGRKKFPEIP